MCGLNSASNPHTPSKKMEISETVVKTFIENAKAELKKELIDELGEIITGKYEELEEKITELKADLEKSQSDSLF